MKQDNKGRVEKILTTFNVKQFLKFIFVGFINTGVFYSIYYVLLQLGFFYAVALTIGNIIGIINSYLWNKFFTFGSKKRSIGETIKFLVIAIMQYFLNLLIVYLCVDRAGISPESAGLIAISISVFFSYFGHKFWSFREADNHEQDMKIRDITIKRDYKERNRWIYL